MTVKGYRKEIHVIPKDEMEGAKMVAEASESKVKEKLKKTYSRDIHAYGSVYLCQVISITTESRWHLNGMT